MAKGRYFSYDYSIDLMTPNRAHKDRKRCVTRAVSDGQNISVGLMMQTITLLLVVATHLRAKLEDPLVLLLEFVLSSASLMFSCCQTP